MRRLMTSKRRRSGILVVLLLVVFGSSCGGDGGSGIPCERHETSCICGDLADEPEDFACAASEYADGYCCQSATEDRCACNQPTCALDEGSDICFCEAAWRHDADSVPRITCVAPVGGHCCLFPADDGDPNGSICACAVVTSCADVDAIDVGECTPASVATCGDFATPVASCN